ncbi:DUF45 domain-containing protein [Candidatus Mycosynbacter amalyticus]|uniref:DUF45 domain-containing protein n=1 Tax=Candidatus Mycosynbacter amalyticus TaxID=2665156 RepID=A0A857MJP6_9BACT|nr:SprT family zinc-dependent metalloprotease [Candidatus Mycosynbacter amalyticus]QHN42786.1 DUF45 domain-containing protein [Candidatus Mycosynbacter amalyticus]
MAIYTDDEFGAITIRKSHRSRSITLSVAPNGMLRASMPVFASTRSLKKLIADSRTQIRSMLTQHAPKVAYADGMQIGKSHSLLVTSGPNLHLKRQQLKLVLTLPPTYNLTDAAVQQLVREHTLVALRKEARHYLPRRLSTLADELGCKYERVRFSHASTRWGSCSSRGTISLNIALMQLPFELIDYVLIHELCHTKQMNHSRDFWQLVEQADPEYSAHRRTIKQYSPTI